jgi:hypothetical protein
VIDKIARVYQDAHSSVSIQKARDIVMREHARDMAGVYKETQHEPAARWHERDFTSVARSASWSAIEREATREMQKSRSRRKISS